MTMEARGITFAFDSTADPVLRGVSASAPAGAITAILGANAAGKTTLLRVLAGALTPHQGAALIHGQAVADLHPAERARRLAYVPQRPGVDAPFSVREVVTLGTYSTRGGKAAVQEAMELCDVAGIADRKWPELSAGQQQRTALARALAQLHRAGEGQALLLDEPFSALDARHVAETATLLRATAARGACVVTVLHDLSLAARWADYAWCLREGQMVAMGSISEVMTASVLRKVYDADFTWTGPGGTIPIVRLQQERSGGYHASDTPAGADS